MEMLIIFKIKILIILFIWALSKDLKNLESTFDQRLLNTCSSYSNWDDCNEDSQWTFLNGSCQDVSSNALDLSSYNQFLASRYWANSLRFGNIKLYDLEDNTLEMYALPGASASGNSIWQWSVLTYDDVKLKVTLERDPRNFENLIVYTSKQGNVNTLASKDLSDWDTGTVSVEIGPVAYARFGFEILSNSSNYKMTISQESKDQKFRWYLILMIALTAGISLLIFCFMGSYVWIKLKEAYRYNQMVRVREIQADERSRTKDQRIRDTLASMTEDCFKNINTRYEQSEWVVCLEKFEDDSMVYVTNECSHVFHKEWLFSWYDNMTVYKDLWCPHWNTVNLPKTNYVQTIKNEDEVDDRMERGNSDSSIRPMVTHSRRAVVPYNH